MVTVVTGEGFNEALNAPVAVVDFSATWCGPCKMLAPVIHELSDEMTDIPFFNVDVDDDMDIAEKYGIQSVPTVIVLKNGEEAARSLGFKPKAVYQAFIEGAAK